MYKCQVQYAVRGYHVYQNIWTATIGEVLSCEKEPRNAADPYTVATVSAGVIVGHVSQEFSCVFLTFLTH